MNREERDSTDSMEDEMIINLFIERSEQAIAALTAKYGKAKNGAKYAFYDVKYKKYEAKLSYKLNTSISF